MTKTEILEVLKVMLNDWLDCYAYPVKEIIAKKYTYLGFCAWLEEVGYFPALDILLELKKDKDVLLELSNNCTGFWYKPVFRCVFTKEVKQSLKFRIDHLQRTITRLENEIKSEN